MHHPHQYASSSTAPILTSATDHLPQIRNALRPRRLGRAHLAPYPLLRRERVSASSEYYRQHTRPILSIVTASTLFPNHRPLGQDGLPLPVGSSSKWKSSRGPWDETLYVWERMDSGWEGGGWEEETASARSDAFSGEVNGDWSQVEMDFLGIC